MEGPMTESAFAVAGDGSHIAYRVEGPPGAPAVLFSHCLGLTMAAWDAQAAALRERFRVVRYDARGHGASEAPVHAYDIATLANDALAVMDAADVEAAHVVGLSMGGMVGMRLAIHTPQRVCRLVLANTTAHIPLRDMWNSRIATALNDGMSSIAAPTIDRWLGADTQARASELRDALVADMRSMSAVGYAGCCAALRDADQRDELHRIAVPTLVITGAQDAAASPAVAQALSAAIAGSRVAVIDGAAHLSNLEQPEAFNRLIAEFLA
jgi:3-oxoadipate enol-lactonase